MPQGKNWDGVERRKVSREQQIYRNDHDAIVAFGIEIGNHAKAIETLASNHEIQFVKVNERIDWLYRLVYIGVGIAITIQFLLKYGVGD